MKKVLVQLLIVFGTEDLKADRPEIYWANMARDYCEKYFSSKGNFRSLFGTSFLFSGYISGPSLGRS